MVMIDSLDVNRSQLGFITGIYVWVRSYGKVRLLQSDFSQVCY